MHTAQVSFTHLPTRAAPWLGAAWAPGPPGAAHGSIRQATMGVWNTYATPLANMEEHLILHCWQCRSRGPDWGATSHSGSTMHQAAASHMLQCGWRLTSTAVGKCHRLTRNCHNTMAALLGARSCGGNGSCHNPMTRLGMQRAIQRSPIRVHRRVCMYVSHGIAWHAGLWAHALQYACIMCTDMHVGVLPVCLHDARVVRSLSGTCCIMLHLLCLLQTCLEQLM